MADESDGVSEAFDGAVRLSVMAGARLGSEIARARRDRLRAESQRDRGEAERFRDRLEAERRLAVAELSQVYEPRWWDSAGPERVGSMYATARAWGTEDEAAARAERRIREELVGRYGIDVSELDPAGVSAQVEAWRHRLEEQRRVEADRDRAGVEAERVEADRLLGQAVQPDETLPLHECGRVYDSPSRRADDAHVLEESGIDKEVAASRVRADAGVAVPATAATAGADRRGRASRSSWRSQRARSPRLEVQR